MRPRWSRPRYIMTWVTGGFLFGRWVCSQKRRSPRRSSLASRAESGRARCNCPAFWKCSYCAALVLGKATPLPSRRSHRTVFEQSMTQGVFSPGGVQGFAYPIRSPASCLAIPSQSAPSPTDANHRNSPGTIHKRQKFAITSFAFFLESAFSAYSPAVHRSISQVFVASAEASGQAAV